MLTSLGRLLKKSPPTNDRRKTRARLGVEVLEGRDVPAVVYTDTFVWNEATVEATVDDAVPGYAGLYHWNYHVTNDSFAEGIGTFALPADEAWMVSNLGSSSAWFGSVGTLMGNPDLVSWESSGPVLGIGGSTDFWFTTLPTDIALTNGIVSNLGLTTTPGGFVAVPLAVAPEPPQPFPHPAILVATDEDTSDPDDGLTSLREAVEYANNHPLLSARKIRFSAGLTDKPIALGIEGDLLILKDMWINGTNRNITITRGALFLGESLIALNVNTTAVIEGLTFTGGGTNQAATQNVYGGAINSTGILTLRSCVFHNNHADNGGAISASKGTLEIVGCSIYNNHAHNSGMGLGGGVYIGPWVTTATITNSSIYDNTATDKGGGIYIVGGDTEENVNTSITLSNTSIRQNMAQNRGGGVAVDVNASPHLRLMGNTIIAFNWLWGVDSKGGGVFLGAGTVTTDGVSFVENQATFGDGLYMVNGTSWIIGAGGVEWFNDDFVFGP